MNQRDVAENTYLGELRISLGPVVVGLGVVESDEVVISVLDDANVGVASDAQHSEGVAGERHHLQVSTQVRGIHEEMQEEER